MKFTAFILILTVISGLNAQSIRDFNYLKEEYNERTFIDINPTYTMVRNQAAPFPEHHKINGWSGSLTIRKADFSRGAWQYRYEHRLLFDLILILQNMVDGDGQKYYRSETSALTTGLIGWWSFAPNVIANDRLTVGVGANFNDYFLGASYRLDSLSQDLTTLEPQGYWFAGGPAFFSDLRLNSTFLLHMHASYSMGFWRAVSLSYADTEINDAFKKPHFGGINVQLQSRWGVFLGFSHNWLVNRSPNPNATTRSDIHIGFKLPL